jgi:hypothetical protein
MTLTHSIQSSVALRALHCVSTLAASFALTSCARTHASQPITPQTMMAAVRQYGRIPEPSQGAPKAKLIAQKVSSAQSPLETETEYKRHIVALLASGEYDQLERAARDDRASKGRIVGGAWRLYNFYDAVTYPLTQPSETEVDWKAHIETMKRWNSLHPESATARIALAGSYLNFGWFARGSDYADSVSQEGWDLLADRTELAKTALLEAARLKDKCPYWFELVQTIANIEGWDKPLAKEIFERATAFEPTYYHFYREYANYMLPKWNGEDGEAQNFAEEISDRLGGEDGDIIYFEIASLLACQCHSTKTALEGLSWPRILKGYTAINQRYSVSNLKLNRLAVMAYFSDDKPVAQQAFVAIGEDWDHTVWKNQQTFQDAKAWAASQ